MFEIIQEGKARIEVSSEKKISKKLPVFYNPVMKLNRDISIALLNSVPDKSMQMALPLAGSGVRGIRLMLELKKGKLERLFMNDIKEDFRSTIKKNFSLNKIPKIDVVISNEDANLFMLNSSGFDYIDIDPFGTPNPFLDSAAKRISRGGILAATATDTSALAGTYEDACWRKYWASPLRNELKHEVGIRILIRKIQLIGAQYDKALTPIFSYSKEHYFKVFLRCEKSKKAVDKIIKEHGMFEGAGPMWLGALWDGKIAAKMLKNATGEAKKLVEVIAEESKIETAGFHDIHQICKEEKIIVPNFESIMNALKKKGYKSSRTHFSGVGIRSNIERKKMARIVRSIQ